MVKELKPDRLRREIDIKSLNWKELRKKKPPRPLIGQERALKALEFGIGNKSGGFNIYVSGYPGSGKTMAVNHFLEEIGKLEPSPGDWCYVNNFKDAYYPRKLLLPKGGAQIFKNEIETLIQEIQKLLLTAFESKEYAEKRQNIIDDSNQKKQELFVNLHKKAKKNNFAIRLTPIEILVIPVDKSGMPLSDNQFSKLNDKKKKDLLNKQDELKEELRSLLRVNRDMERDYSDSLRELDRNVALYSIDSLLAELRQKYQEFEDILDHLENVKNDILDNLPDFLDKAPTRGIIDQQPIDKFLKYKVNVLTDNSNLEGAPIITELNPTYTNLFGKVEHESHMGSLVTNFTLIRGGVLHRANGGYLILPFKELLQNYFSWDGLKRAISNKEIVIEDTGERLGFLSSKSLKPDPIPLDIQVILIGAPKWYYLFYEWDEDFRELFKVKAEFDTMMEYSIANIKDFAGVIYKIEKENQLIPLSEIAMKSLLEQAVRIAQDRRKISIKFREISDILHEANHYARQEKSNEIGDGHIRKAIEERYYRSNLIQEKINELIRERILMIELSGAKIGQINGISVIDLGDITFGRPNKITASVSSGRGGLVDIEREAKLGGPIHTKGVLILQGYLLDKYAQDKPLGLYGSLVFEQSYSEIEGDSASSAELYAILSSLSQVPIKQGIAVTGSVNQKGELQAVGAINEKIEGYYEICQQAGLNGEQGVIIPHANINNLILKSSVIQAIEAGQFHIWAIKNIDEGIEILTGIRPGRLLKSGLYSKDSVHYKVDERIRKLNHILKQDKKGKKERSIIG